MLYVDTLDGHEQTLVKHEQTLVKEEWRPAVRLLPTNLGVVRPRTAVTDTAGQLSRDPPTEVTWRRSRKSGCAMRRAIGFPVEGEGVWHCCFVRRGEGGRPCLEGSWYQSSPAVRLFERI